MEPAEQGVGQVRHDKPAQPSMDSEGLDNFQKCRVVQALQDADLVNEGVCDCLDLCSKLFE